MNGIVDVNKLHPFDDWQVDVFANYSGSDRKDGLISPDGQRYLIKFANNHTRVNDMDTSYVNNVVCEYLSSHILSIIGYDVHETLLGIRNGEVTVACKNFTSANDDLIEFGTFMKKHYYSTQIDRVPSLEQIQDILVHDPLLQKHREMFMESYAERLIGDALVGNFDRHMGNWGYIVTENGVKAAPIYDNGSTLFPALSEKGMLEVLSEEKEIFKRIRLFPTVALTVNGQKVTYWDMLASNYSPVVTRALIKMTPIIEQKMPEIRAFINDCDYISDIRKEFYTKILTSRYKYLIEKAYRLCVLERYDKDAYNRLENGINYTEAMFENEFSQKNKSNTRCR